MFYNLSMSNFKITVPDGEERQETHLTGTQAVSLHEGLKTILNVGSVKRIETTVGIIVERVERNE